MTKYFLYIAVTLLAVFTSCSQSEVTETVKLDDTAVEATKNLGKSAFTIDNLNSQVMEKDVILLTNNSENAVSYHWDFGNGDTSEEANPTYDYALHGYFEVKLTVTDEYGHTTESSHHIEVLCPFEGRIHTTGN